LLSTLAFMGQRLLPEPIRQTGRRRALQKRRAAHSRSRADLLSRMTLEENIDQLNWGWQQKIDVVDPTNTFAAESARKALGAEWGGDIQLTPRNAVQRYQLEKTRLGIPVMFPGEALPANHLP
jgi:hypothetical protein